MKEKEFTFIAKISKSEVDILMEQALNGMSYWADNYIVKFKSHNPEVEYEFEEVARGGILMIHDGEEDKWHELGINKLIKGLEKTRNLDFTEYDMFDAEQVIQRALFGKVIYA